MLLQDGAEAVEESVRHRSTAVIGLCRDGERRHHLIGHLLVYHYLCHVETVGYDGKGDDDNEHNDEKHDNLLLQVDLREILVHLAVDGLDVARRALQLTVLHHEQLGVGAVYHSRVQLVVALIFLAVENPACQPHQLKSLSGVDVCRLKHSVLHLLYAAAGSGQGVHSIILYVFQSVAQRHLSRSQCQAVVMPEHAVDAGVVSEHLSHRLAAAFLGPVAQLR